MISLFRSRYFVWAVIGAIVLAVSYGVFLTGSPSRQRALQFDLRRVSDLEQISYALNAYWERNGKLPAAVEDLEKQNLYALNRDQKTEAPYEYNVLGESAYELCAVFDLESPPSLQGPYLSKAWEHGAGRNCFEREVAAP